MDTSHLLYQAAAASLDSWDLENLRYLRKISSGYRASASAKSSSKAEESYCDSTSYQSLAKANGKKTPASGRSSRLEIATTVASVHNSSSCDGDEEDDSLLLPLHLNQGTKSSNSEVQIHNESDEETIHAIEEFSSYCGNIRSIPVPDAKINDSIHAMATGCGRIAICDNDESIEFDDIEEPASLGSRPLDTCYQLDILTIRNESVLATKNQAMAMRTVPPCKIPKAMVMAKHGTDHTNGNCKKQLRNGSDGFSSSGESSGMDEGTLYSDDRCSHAAVPQLPYTRSPRKKNCVSQRLSSSSSPSCSSSSAYSSSIPSTLLEDERTAVCPFCDGVGARLPSSSSRTYYYMGENENGSTTRERKLSSPGKKTSSPSQSSSGVGVDSGGVDADTTDASSEPRPCSSNDNEADEGAHNEGSGSPPPLPRTPSPYYVRLRRDLITSYSPALCPPRNFGMDKQGQLVIDYSQNWVGLEKYIENLRLNPVNPVES